MQYAAQTNIGPRLQNEDSLLYPQEGHKGPQIVAVADGMGGHAAGKRASTLAVEGLHEHLADACTDTKDPIQCMRSAIRKVNLDIYHHSRTEEGCRGMGTTLTLAMLFDEQYIVANVGDSRLYHFDGWSLTQVTHDHSLVAVLVASGEITPAEAHMHPQRNIITRALGTSQYEEADFFQRRWSAGDVLLLCSDGLHASVDDETIERILREEKPLSGLCDDLVNAAIANQARDNITVVLARHEGGAA